MAKYVAQIVNAGSIESTKKIVASTPVQAAIKFAGGEVTFRRNQGRWINIMPAGAQTTYQFVKA